MAASSIDFSGARHPLKSATAQIAMDEKTTAVRIPPPFRVSLVSVAG
jgi:hypothetical protein